MTYLNSNQGVNNMAINKKYTVNSFFAGIGGFDLGFEHSGFDIRFQVENNEFCQHVLNKHWPNTKSFSDIRLLKPSDIPHATVWCGGFPCQDVSVARGAKGREGLKGKNSGLFFPFLDLIKENKPKVLLLENVTGLLSSHEGRDFQIILKSLSDLNYGIAWRVLNSRFFGVPQSRPRVFIVAVHKQPEIASRTLYENKPGSIPKDLRKGFMEVSESPITGAKIASVAYCLAATSGRHTGTDWSRTYVSYDSSVRRLTPIECEGIQGFPKYWTDLEKRSHKYNGELDTYRYHSLGNAVSVPTVKWIAKRIKNELSKSIESQEIFSPIQINCCPDFKSSSIREFMIKEDPSENLKKIKWQSGGVAFESQVFDVKAPQAPSKIISDKLINSIQDDLPDSKYFLSNNAAEGIIRRVDSQNRTLFPPMRAALEKMINNI